MKWQCEVSMYVLCKKVGQLIRMGKAVDRRGTKTHLITRGIAFVYRIHGRHPRTRKQDGRARYAWPSLVRKGERLAEVAKLRRRKVKDGHGKQGVKVKNET